MFLNHFVHTGLCCLQNSWHDKSFSNLQYVYFCVKNVNIHNVGDCGKNKKTSRADYDFLCPSLFTCVCRQSCRNRQIRVRILHRQATCKMTLLSNLNDWRNLLQHTFFGYHMWCCVAKGAAMGLRSQGSCIFSVYAWRRHSIRHDSEWQL